MATKILNRKGYGLGSPLIDLAPAPIISRRAPGVHDSAELGSIWIDRVLNDVYVLTSISSGSSSWIGCGGGSGSFTTVAATTSVTTPLITNATDIDVTAVAGDITLDAGGDVILDSADITLTTTGILDANITGAVTIDSSAAGVSIDGVLASNLTVTGAGEDLTCSSVGGSVVVTSNEAVATAVTISATDAAGGILVDAGTGGITLDASFVALGGIYMYSGAGEPAAALAVHVGDVFFRTDPTGANDRIYVATVVGTTWTTINCAA
jgi:hypothetical protein